jgi:hypothetical protein
MTTAEQKARLKELSKLLLGSTSGYQRLMTRGHQMPVVEDKEVETTGGDGAVVKTTVKVQARHKGIPQFEIRRYDAAGCLAFLEGLKTRRDELMARIEQDQKDQRRRQAEAEMRQRVQDGVAGSAAV